MTTKRTRTSVCANIFVFLFIFISARSSWVQFDLRIFIFFAVCASDFLQLEIFTKIFLSYLTCVLTRPICCCSCWASFVCTIYQLKFKIMFSVDKRRIENLIAMLAIPSWTINICIKIFFEETIMSKFVTCPAFTRPLFPFNCLKIFIFRLYTA